MTTSSLIIASIVCVYSVGRLVELTTNNRVFASLRILRNGGIY